MSPFDGTLVWIWNLSLCDQGDPGTIAGRLASAGAAGAIVKATDGDHGFNDWTAVAALFSQLRARGLKAMSWGYCYGDNEPAEAAAAISAIKTLSPDAHVLDIEQEFEDQPNTAATAAALAAAVIAAAPTTPLAYSPLPAIALHLRLPYRQLTDAGLAMLPQLYWTGLRWTPQYTVSQFYQGIQKYQLGGRPIYPAYEDAPGSQPTPEDLDVFLGTVKQQGATGISVWSYEHLDERGWGRLARAAQAFPTSGIAADPCQALRQQVDELKGQLAQAAATFAAVRQALGSAGSL